MSFFQPSSESKLAGANTVKLEPPGKPSATLYLNHALNGRPQAPMITDHIPVEAADMKDASMLAAARQCFESSEDYFNASHRTRIMDAMARFRSQHPKGSKYWSDAYARRSKTFRPKTRSTVRKREAAAIIALFSTADVVNLTATDGGSSKAAQDARLQEELLNYRLREDARWYQVCAGMMQDADRQGIVAACTEWEYREATQYFDEQQPNGKRLKHAVKVPVVDRPHIRLIPIENLRFSPAADWLDVVGTTPFLIELRPMFVCEIRAHAKNSRARLKYRDLDDSTLLTGAGADAWDPIRIARDGNKLDRYDRQGTITDYTIVWVHRNIMRIDGEDYVFDTVGTTAMLSNVVPLSEVDPRGYRPYVIGSAMIESHNPFPDGAVTIGGPLQDEINTNANLRTDMNQMATSGRMFVSRTSGVDLNALARFSPGSAVMMDSVESVKWDRPPPPPPTNFEENNLLNTEFDDLLGNFSQGSVAANKQLNETVGGMGMLADVGSQMTEYDLQTLANTFIQPVLRQVLDLVKLYETDRELAATIGAKFAVSERQYWEALTTPTRLIVSVGFGATNPMKRLERLSIGLKTMGEFFPYLMMMADQSEITNEIFGAIGYPDATRFFPFLDQKTMQDPKYKTLIMQLEQMRMLSFPHVAQAQGRAQQGQAQAQGRIQAAQITAQAAIQKQQMLNESNEKITAMQLQLAKVELQLSQENTDIARGALLLKREQLSNQIAMQQEQLILEAQGTPLANPHAVEGPLTPGQTAEVHNLRTPPSGANPVPSVPQMFQNASQIPDGMTGGELAKRMGA